MPTTAERVRTHTGPAILSFGFRPFFLFGAIWAATVVAIWLPMLGGWLAVPSAFSPLEWHVHELIYGYVPAIVAGFLLTAVPNWTGRLPVTGYASARASERMGGWPTSCLAFRSDRRTACRRNRSAVSCRPCRRHRARNHCWAVIPNNPTRKRLHAFDDLRQFMRERGTMPHGIVDLGQAPIEA